MLNTLPGPTISILSHAEGFFVGYVWSCTGLPPTNAIPTKVHGQAMTEHGPPTVTVNGDPATVAPGATATAFTFTSDIALSKGAQTIKVVGVDTMGGTTTITLAGEADYCCKGGSEPGVAAVRGDGQSNRCHEIDGCTTPLDWSETDARRNQPMPGANQNVNGAIEFGSGTIPPAEFFVHGQSPARSLGCNIHDVCYQTCMQGDEAKAAAYSACNLQQYENHVAECRRHYPPTCPWGILRCPDWWAEKENCWLLADLFWRAVSSDLGWDKYLERQNQYCASP